MKDKPRHHVLLVREMPGSSGDCYGDISAAPENTSCRQDFASVQSTAEEIARIYNATRERFSPEEVAITYVDPRAQIVLWAELFRHVWFYRPGLKATLRLLSQWFSVPAVIVDGQILSHQGKLPAIHAVLRMLRPTA